MGCTKIMQNLKLFLWIMGLLPTLSSGQNHSPFQLYRVIHSSTGLIKLACRNSSTLENLDIHTVYFYVNRTSVNDHDLRNRSDFSVVEDRDSNMIEFTLTGASEGMFTCGRRIDDANIRESPPLTLICKYTKLLLSNKTFVMYV